MRTALLTVTLYAPFVHSLKEKRTQVKSLTTRLRTKFNISIAESAQQDMHQIIVLTIAALASDARLADSIMDHIIHFIEENTEAQIIHISRQLQ